MIYLDNAATTKLHPEVLKAMIDSLSSLYGNANSQYYLQATDSKKIIESSRKNVANIFGVKENEIIFTSGAAESNNMIIKGICDKYPHAHIISTAIEHSSIIESLKYVESKNSEVTLLKVDQSGLISISELENSIRPNTKLVSIMWANNEIGTINNIKVISELCNRKGILFHTDATQAVGKIDCNLKDLPFVDLLSMSAHKIYGPKGIGCCIIRNLDMYNPPFGQLIHGGDQEYKMRGGTLPTHQIVGFGVAAKICSENLQKNIQILKTLEKQLWNKLKKEYGEKVIQVNDFENRIPGLLSVRFKGVNNQVLLKSISDDIAASSGAACSNTHPSHVLEAIGFNPIMIKEVVRFSLSPYDEYNSFDAFK